MFTLPSLSSLVLQFFFFFYSLFLWVSLQIRATHHNCLISIVSLFPLLVTLPSLSLFYLIISFLSEETCFFTYWVSHSLNFADFILIMFFKKICSTVSHVSCEIVVRSKGLSRFEALFVCVWCWQNGSRKGVHTSVRRHIMSDCPFLWPYQTLMVITISSNDWYYF